MVQRCLSIVLWCAETGWRAFSHWLECWSSSSKQVMAREMEEMACFSEQQEYKHDGQAVL